MAKKSTKPNTVPAPSSKEERIFIDRLVEILIMQVEANENNNEHQRVLETV
ncbi:hypothetical protein KGQ27_02555 [Patescibacteria group bacterium]|nr:hypothetical protein [Patescibacteria group bacterium]MDE1946448.1 hypothetical protein [Patescibacteria group bacterium]